MVELTGKRKVYSEFLTNLAVAWATAGLISPLYTKPKDLTEVLVLIAFGILGTGVSLRLAVLWSKGVQNGSY